MNPTTCPSCSAPLEPLATRCQYCGVVTTRGREEAERAEHEARARQAYAQATAAAQASMAQAAAAQEVARNASRAVLGSILGVVFCCAPSSWIGAFFAWRSLTLAGKHGIPKPTSAYVAVGLCVLGTVVSLTTCVAFELDQREKRDRQAAAEARSEPGRKRATLDAKTACDITEAYVFGDQHPGLTVATDAELACRGTLEMKGSIARLSGVVLTQRQGSVTYRACFARGARWYLLDLAERGDCGQEAPKADTVAEEKAARAEFAKGLGKLTLSRFEERLARAKGAVERATPGTEKLCANLAPRADAPLNKVRAVDFALLDGRPDAEFAFLSDPQLTSFLRRGASVVEKQKMATELAPEGDLLVVYREKSRSLPQVIDKGAGQDYQLQAGEYDGTLFVVDGATGEIACQGPLAWKTPAKAPFSLTRSRATRTSVQTTATEDFRHRFQDAATERLKRLTNGGLKLGYKPLE